MQMFAGYGRDDGQIGVRNRIVVLPTSVAASAVADDIAAGETPVETLSDDVDLSLKRRHWKHCWRRSGRSQRGANVR
ncbi:UxaA family hydrolase [Natrialba asiatica]|uniref:Altronate dehydratase n=1 Tax=Natrialba asiatica (strain ATCC 700177 / DSM 12278 / JCM 9576 / FERM P-10747 / NBRC 102637 / 172P1) TaxID=29540 RepID=M0B6Y7_NATA1|nr:UxaA family hydrolase [Natrialba asiatica]ELZ05414.1 Altronate dehydratase [Natrialba asiatica DSM 12278]